MPTASLKGWASNVAFYACTKESRDKVNFHEGGGGGAKHIASHPVPPGSIFGSPKNLSEQCLSIDTVNDN